VKRLASRRAPIAVVLATVLALSSVAPAFAATTIYVTGKYVTSLGVGNARLMKARSTNISILGKRSYTGKDTSYAYTVYLDCWGAKLTSGRNKGKYPLHMWSKSKDGVFKTFQFTCYNANYVTTKGIKVGSTGTQLKSAYGSALKSRVTPTYVIYTLNSAYKWKTDFYFPRSGTGVGKVSQINIWTL
jgi:hypothetical protein